MSGLTVAQALAQIMERVLDAAERRAEIRKVRQSGYAAGFSEGEGADR